MKQFWILLFLVFAFSAVSAQWFQKVDTLSINLDSSYCYGASWIDVDNDNDLDLYHSLAGIGGPNNQLHLNNGDGTFTKMTGLNIVGHGGKSVGNGWADINNDGEPDLFVNNTSPDSNFLYVNNGSGSSFTRLTTGSIASDIAPNEGNSSWGDFDNDGFVDLYVVTWNNSANLFYQNNGGSSFTKITTGAIATDASWSSCSIWGDYDDDGDLDLYVANYVDQTGTAPATNKLYQNNGNGTFTSISTGSPVTDAAKSRSANWVDYDNDGDLDLYVANESADHLYQNNGNGTFTSITSGLIVTENVRADACNWGDFDNDGDLDLFKVGQISGAHRFFENMGNGTFNSINPDNVTGMGIWMVGVGFVDYDMDGWLDIHAMNYGDNQKDFVWRNVAPNCNAFAQFRLQGDSSNWSAIGTKVRVKANINGNATWQLQQIAAQTAKGVQNPQFLHFGLGDAAVMDSVIVEWPAGGTCIFTNVSVKKFYRIEESCLISTIVEMGYDPFGADTVICGGDTLWLDATAPGVSSWTWQNGSTDSIIAVTSAGQYWVATDSGGSCNASDSIGVGVFWPETVELGSDTTLCSGSSIKLSAAGGGFGPWLWSDGSTDSTLTVNAPGTFWVAAGPVPCEKRDTVIVSLTNGQQIYLGPDSLICDGDSLQFSALGFTSVTWMDTIFGNSFIANSAGTYWVEAIDSNGCTSFDTIQLTVCTGFLSSEKPRIIVYPNPTTAILNIDLSNGKSMPASVHVFDLRGVQLVERKINVPDVLRLDSLQAGTYFVEVNCDDRISRFKISFLR